MFRKVVKGSSEWILPWLIGVGLIWSIAVPARSAESVDVPSLDETQVAGGMSLYDMSNLPRKIRRVVFRAAVYGKRGEYQKAVDMLKDHLREHPDQDHYLLRMHLAQNLADLKKTDHAAQQYRQAVTMEPRLDRAWFGLADAAYELKDFATAGDAFAAGYRTSTEPSSQVLSYAGTSYLLAEQPSKAFAIFNELISGRIGSPQLKWYQGLIVAAARMEEPQRADTGVRQMLATFPDDPEAWYLAYQHEAGRGNFASAAVNLRVVGYLRPTTPAEEKQLGDLYLVTGVPYLASRQYKAALDTAGSVADYERLGSSLVAAHETDEALTVLREALTKADSPRLWALLGDVHYLRREYGPARAAFERIAETDETGRAWLMQGYCALELGEKRAALDLLGRATEFPAQVDMAQILIQRAMRL